jgi:hypothetical protein
MRKLGAILAAVISLAALTALPGAARAETYPWCIEYGGRDGDGGVHCMFVSYEQCRMTATPGSGGFCVRNPYYQQESRSGAVRRHARPSR